MIMPFDVPGVDIKIQLIQDLIPLDLVQVQDVLEKELGRLAKQKGKRNGLPG